MKNFIKKDEIKFSGTNEISETLFRTYKKFLVERFLVACIKNIFFVIFSAMILFLIWIALLGFQKIFMADIFSQFLDVTQIFISSYLLIVFIAALGACLTIAFFKIKHRKFNIADFAHWCDNQNDYQGQLLTAFHIDNPSTETNSRDLPFSDNVLKSASFSLQEKGFPSSFTKADKSTTKKLIFVTLALFLVLGVLLTLTGTFLDIEKMQDETNIIAANQKSTDKNIVADKTLEQNSSKEESPENTPANSEMQKNPKMPEDEKENKEEKIEKKESGDTGDKETNSEDNSDNMQEKEQDKPKENQPEDKTNQGNQGEEKIKNQPEDKAKYEYDPTVVKSEANDGETKNKKDNFYHFNDDSGEGNLIDAEKLAPLLEKDKNLGSFSGFTSEEKKIIDLYRKKLKKLLSSE